MIRRLLKRLLRRRSSRPDTITPTTGEVSSVLQPSGSAPPPPPPRPLLPSPPPPPPPRRYAPAASSEEDELDSRVHLVMVDGTVRRAPGEGELGEQIRYVATNLIGRKSRQK